MRFQYSKHRDVLNQSVVMDGYGSVSGMEGPLRNKQNQVVYYDPLGGRYIPAKEVHRYSNHH